MERYLRVHLLGPGPRLMKKEFTGPRSHKGWETLPYRSFLGSFWLFHHEHLATPISYEIIHRFSYDYQAFRLRYREGRLLSCSVSRTVWKETFATSHLVPWKNRGIRSARLGTESRRTVGAHEQRTISIELQVVEASGNAMAHAQKPDFVFRRNGRVHLNRPRAGGGGRVSSVDYWQPSCADQR